jgi:hypothetical protein
MKFAVITKIPDDLSGGNYATDFLYIHPDVKEEIPGGGSISFVGSNIIVAPPIMDKLLDEMMIKFHTEKDGTTIDLTKEQLVACSVPVFKLGEILILNDHGRSIPDGRKPSKWFVEYEEFNDIEAAVRRAKEVNP